MGYVEFFNEIEQWRDRMRLFYADDVIIRAIEERIAEATDPDRLWILNHFLVEEHMAQGNRAAAEAVHERDTVHDIHCWYRDWQQNKRGVDMAPELEDRIRNETDARRLHALRCYLALEYQRNGDYAAAEAVHLADIAANPDEPMPLISLASQKFHGEEKPEAAVPIIDRAVEVAMRAGVFRRHALASKARIAHGLRDYRTVEDVLRRIMALTFTRGNSDIGVERDILDRLPPGSIDAEVARAYDEYCCAHGKARNRHAKYVDELVLSLAKPQWQKVAKIIAVALKECERSAVDVSGAVVADSILLLVEQGRLDLRGNLNKWRYSEVKLPDAARRNDQPAITPSTHATNASST